jgi:WD40 repeat protein
MFFKGKKISKGVYLLILSTLLVLDITGQETPQLVLPINHTRTINGCDFTKDQRFMVTASSDNTVKVYETASGKEIRTFSVHIKSVNTVFFDKKEEHLYTSSEDGTCAVLNFRTGELIKQIELPNQEAALFAHLDPAEQYLLVQLSSGVVVYNLLTGQWTNYKALK